jgi:pyruvate/2-oxoglutarate dehydrogenase complex dihydrolipoamide dehydrogenase (E3) component
MAAAAPGKSAERLAGLGVRVVSGVGRFINRDTVAVNGTAEIKARRFVIATGSSPSIPAIPGLDTTPYFTGDMLPDLADLPSHLIIIGGGSTGVELAQAFRRLGSRVSLIAASRPLADEDQECARVLLDALEREGVAIHPEIAVEAVRSVSGQIEITLQDGAAAKTIAGSHLLLADRVPAIDRLGLEAARIACGPLGIAVDTGLRTMNRRVYAIGEAAGAPPSAHVANYHAKLVIGNALFRLSPRVRYDAVARATYTDPQLAHIGLTDEQAKQQGYRIRVLRWPFRENDRARAERTSAGHVKAVTNARGRILGATIVGAEAGELIAPWTLAIGQGLNIRAMASAALPHPTRSEASQAAAMSYDLSAAVNPMVRRAMRWLRRLG